MDLELTDNSYAPSATPSACKLGVRLYSTNKEIEDTINRDPLDDDYFFFLLVRDGAFTVFSTCSKNEFGHGLMLMHPVTEREFVFLGKDFKGMLFCIPAPMVSGVWSGSLFTSLDIKSINVLEHYYDLMREALISIDSPLSEIELKSLCNAFTVSCRQHFKPVSGSHNIRASIICSNFLALLDRHCSQNRDLKFYAGLLELSPKYLSAVISSTTKKNACKWIEEYSIAHAKKLLLNTMTSISDVAAMMKFPSSSDFCRYFHKSTGFTPGKYRQSNMRSVVPLSLVES